MNPILKTGLSVVILLVSLTLTSSAQNAPTNIEVFFKPIDPTATKDTLDTNLRAFNVIYAISISGTTGIDKFHVKLGNTPGGGERASHVIDFDPQGNLPAGMSYSRKGNTVYIGMGAHPNRRNYHAQVQTEDSNGNRSGVVKKMK